RDQDRVLSARLAGQVTADAVTEARRGAVGDLRRPVEVPGGVDPAAAVEGRRLVLDPERRPGTRVEPTAALGAQAPPPRPERRKRHAREARAVMALHDEPCAPPC